jgi:hypothetical protein
VLYTTARGSTGDARTLVGDLRGFAHEGWEILKS